MCGALGCVGHGREAPATTPTGATVAPTEANETRASSPPSPRDADCTPSGADDDASDPEHGGDDGFEAPSAAAQGAQTPSAPLPFAKLSDAELKSRLSPD